MIFFRTGLSKCGRLDITWSFTVIFPHLFRFVWDIQKKEKEYILVAEKRSSTRRNASHGSMGRLDDEPMRQCATMVVAGVDGEGANGRAEKSKKSVDGRCAWPVRNWCAGRGEAFAERMQQLRRRAGAAVLSWQSALLYGAHSQRSVHTVEPGELVCNVHVRSGLYCRVCCSFVLRLQCEKNPVCVSTSGLLQTDGTVLWQKNKALLSVHQLGADMR